MKTEWKNFTSNELNCSCCNEPNTSLEFRELMDDIQDMRDELGFAFNVTSAYRCPDHPIEAKKDKYGMHTIAAIDINIYGDEALQLMKLALDKGFTGIGIKQKGPYNKRFIHLDKREGLRKLWSY